MKLSDLTEGDLLAGLLGKSKPGRDVVVGPGDDCAVIKISGSKDLLLLKADSIVHGVHFDDSLPPARAGRKALCRALSDIAAMGGRPDHALISIFSPPGVSLQFWKEFYRGLMQAGRRYAVEIVGGEMSRAPVIAVSVALTGNVSPRSLVRRSGGRPGDALFVTGRLGGSIHRKHWAFEPRLTEGQWLAKQGFPRAMMDLSDGLASDLPRLASASGCGYRLSLEKIPISARASLHQALTDGEDYELLFAVRAAKADQLEKAWSTAFPKLHLSRIGHLTTPKNGEPQSLSAFEHFKKS